jgi:hypothetical protein
MPCKLAYRVAQHKRKEVANRRCVSLVEVIRKLWRALMLHIEAIAAHSILDAVACDYFA